MHARHRTLLLSGSAALLAVGLTATAAYATAHSARPAISSRLTGLDISLSGSGCSGVLDGSAAGANNGTSFYQFYNNPDWLINRQHGDLHVYNVSGCTGLFNSGDAFAISYIESFSGIYITSP